MRSTFASSWIVVLVSSWIPVFAATALPDGAVTLINEDRYGSVVALCADTGEPAVQRGARTVRATGVWVGSVPNFRRVQAGTAPCDPSWSPDGRRLAVTSAEGLWVVPAGSAKGSLRVEARMPLGGPTEFSYRAFSSPKWSPDGVLLAVVVTNGGTAWVEVFDAAMGRLFYTSPPENYSVSWASSRALKLGSMEVHLSSHR